MKKYIILAIIVIVTITSITYLYTNYLNNNEVKLNNQYYTELYNKEILGSNLATIINKTLDKNSKNEVEKDENEYYLDNGTNSVIIEIKFIESENIYRIEKISQKGIENFIKLYANFKFKCTKIEYHTKTNFVSYLYFQQL